MQFVDHVRIVVASGAGGDGQVAWRREKFVAYGGPAGGDGGQGGDVIIEATDDLHTLLDFKYKSQFKAGDGERGRSKNCHGKDGPDLVVRVPCGTIVRDTQSGNAIGDLTHPGDKLLVAVGGRGGRGNSRFTNSKRQAPQFAEPGEPEVQRELDLELKLIADVGLIGMPNAGKSTLISVISAAKPKIADYPFTTLVPNLGVVRRPSGDGIVMADIPGLIEGASEGVGLGHEFLRHVERTRLLLHLVDIASMENDDPIATYELINRELKRYSEKLAEKPQLIVLTKTDAVGDSEEIERFKKQFETRFNLPVFTISAVTRAGLEPLQDALFQHLDQLPAEELMVDIMPDVGAFTPDDSAYEIKFRGDAVLVLGGKLERLVRVTDARNTAAMRRMMNIFKAMGVFKALESAGVVEGQSVIIGGFEFEYFDENK